MTMKLTITLLAMLWAATASAVTAPDPEPDPEPAAPTAEATAPDEPGEGTTCQDRIPACGLWVNPDPVTDQNYSGGKL